MAKTETMYVRVEEEIASQFDERAGMTGKTRSSMLRELIDAYAEKRVTLSPRDPDLYKKEHIE